MQRGRLTVTADGEMVKVRCVSAPAFNGELGA